MAWSSEPVIQNALTERAWDGTLPQNAGDFFFEGEFEYAAKNGRGLHRTFDHNVVLHADGSATDHDQGDDRQHAAARLRIRPQLNIDSLSFITLYGPDGATLGAASDPPDAQPPALAGHPAASWFEAADPISSTSFTVVWNVPHLLTPANDGTSDYQLHFMRLTAHDGDVLHLHVTLPPGWSWTNGAPPATTTLNGDVNGVWRLQH